MHKKHCLTGWSSLRLDVAIAGFLLLGLGGTHVTLLAQTPVIPVPTPTVVPPVVPPPDPISMPPKLAEGGYRASASFTLQLGAPINTDERTGRTEAPLAPVSVLPKSRVQLVVQSVDSREQKYQWYKDGIKLDQTSPTYEIVEAASADSGVYFAEVVLAKGNGPPAVTISVPLRVEPQQGARCLNFSARVRVDTSQPSFITGFVIATAPGRSSDYKLVAIRAIGPSLSSFGVTDALANPRLKIYDSKGRDPLVAPRPTTVVPSWLEIAKLTGAFPIPLPLFSAKDAQMAVWLPAGAYTVVVSSEDGGAGTVLLEIYEVPFQ